MVTPDLYATEHVCLQCPEMLEVGTDFVTGRVQNVRCRLARDLRSPHFPMHAFQGRGVKEPVCWPQASLRNRHATRLRLSLGAPFDKDSALEAWLRRQKAVDVEGRL